MQNLDNIQFVTVDILDNKVITFLRRSGPVYNMTVHIANFKFMVAHNFNLKIINYVNKEGEVILAEGSVQDKLAVKEAEVTIPEAVAEVLVVETPVEVLPAIQVITEEVIANETVVEANEEVDLTKIALIDTITVDDSDEVKVKVLPLEIYANRTKAELLDFLTTIESTLTVETSELLKDSKISKKHLMEIIEKEVAVAKL